MEIFHAKKVLLLFLTEEQFRQVIQVQFKKVNSRKKFI